MMAPSPSIRPARAGALPAIVPGGACRFGVPLANVEVPLAPVDIARVTEADIYEDAVVIYAADRPVVSLTVDSAIGLARAVLETYRQSPDATA